MNYASGGEGVAIAIFVVLVTAILIGTTWLAFLAFGVNVPSIGSHEEEVERIVLGPDEFRAKVFTASREHVSGGYTTLVKAGSAWVPIRHPRQTQTITKTAIGVKLLVDYPGFPSTFVDGDNVKIEDRSYGSDYKSLICTKYRKTGLFSGESDCYRLELR